MRSISISSLESISLDGEGEVVGVETIPHLGITLIARKEELVVVENGKMTRRVEWRELPMEGDSIVIFGVIEERAVAVYDNGLAAVIDPISGEREERMIDLPQSILAGSINPVSGVIAIVCENYTLTIIDPLFDIIVEGIDLKNEERGKDELVTVGWGSEKTQFQGKAGKEEREKAAACRKAREEDREGMRVEWRGDGELMVVNYYDDEKEERESKVFNSEGELISRLLRSSRMGGWTGFRPMGNMIGVSGEEGVIMAERNGEKRNGVVRVDEVLKDARIKSGGWNIDASVLALHVERKEEGKEYLMFWMCSNFDWSCKLVLPFEGKIPAWRWDSERWNELVLVSPSNDLFHVGLALHYHSVDGLVASMGTSSLRLTNLNRVSIPPPMAELSIPLPPLSALFLDGAHSIWTIVAIDVEEMLHIYFLEPSSTSPLTVTLLSSFKLGLPLNGVVTGVSFLEGGLLSIGVSSGGRYETMRLNVEGKEMSRLPSPRAVLGERREYDGSISTLMHNGRLEGEEGRGGEEGAVREWRWAEQWVSKGVYILRSSSILYQNERVIAKGVLSFTLSPPFLAWVDNEYKMHVMDTEKGEEAESRSVEKGARVVAIAPPKIILQMGRGNIETIHARFFVLRSVKALLTNGEVKKGLVEMRKHGISFTLLKEYPQVFESAMEWLEGMDDVNLLSLVVTQLRSDQECNSLSSSLCSSLLSLPPSTLSRLFPSLLTSLLLSTPPRLKEAFRYITEYLPKDGSRPSTLRHWLQVCTFFMNPANIFKSSLSTYDLEFVVEVVEALSIDPNEYMATLRELNEMSDLSYRAYKMDLLREDWEEALRSIAKCQPSRMDEVSELIKSKSLYSLALEIYGDADEKREEFDQIGLLCLDEYIKGGRWREGAIIGRMIGEKEKEKKCREKMGDVRGWMEVVESMGLNEEEKREKIEEWKGELIRGSKWSTVAELMDHAPHCSWEDRMEMREKGRDWMGIVREVEREKKEEVERRGREGMRRGGEEMKRECEESEKEIKRLSARLTVVREKKRDLIERMGRGEMELEDLERCDAFSESSLASSRSSSSRSSRISTMSRRAKKIEKKKGSLKEGGEWEDAAILRVCHAEWNRSRERMAAAPSLLSGLVSLRLFSTFSSLSSALSSLETTMTTLAPVIWPPTMEPCHLTGPMSHIFGEGMMPEGTVGWKIAMDEEMNGPNQLNEGEKKWRMVL